MCQFRTPCPPDHDTVWGFIAAREPHVLDLMEDPVSGLFEEQARAQDIAQRGGFEFVPVPSPPAVAAVGVTEVFAFPTAVLNDVFPV